jgi:hypothetical protein
MRKLSGRVGETSVLVQSGQEVSELPLLVKRIRDSNELNTWLRNSEADNELKNIQGAMIKEPSKKMSIDEEYELISGFSRCYNSSSIFTLLQTIPITEITPQVASHALKKVFELEITLRFVIQAFEQQFGEVLSSTLFKDRFLWTFFLTLFAAARTQLLY